ncbi:hypothetical protein Tco_0012206 [Tanacetum coccineum]
MVRYMVSQNTLPKSFKDYALESVARILNMVPTKNVDKTPYEVRHGKAPKLSYLKDTQRKRWDILSTTVTPRQGGNARRNVMDIIITQWCRNREFLKA